MKDYLDSYDIWDTFDYIVPVPLHKKRLKERGYNQSELIAKEVAEYLKIPMRTDLLIRTKATKKQSSLVRTERYNQMYPIYHMNQDNFSSYRQVILHRLCNLRILNQV